MFFLSFGEKWGHDRRASASEDVITGTKSPHAGLKDLKILLALYGAQAINPSILEAEPQDLC